MKIFLGLGGAPGQLALALVVCRAIASCTHELCCIFQLMRGIETYAHLHTEHTPQNLEIIKFRLYIPQSRTKVDTLARQYYKQGYYAYV